MAKQDDGLFLLEVLIDKIIYSTSPCFSDKSFRTCVSIQCPGCDPLILCDDETGGSRTGLNDSPFVKSFNSGKSCLFSLKQSDISSAMSKFEIKVSVFKELPCGCLPTKINLGEATIDMTKEFVQTRKTFMEDPNNVSYQALKDSFHIKGADGTETGEILMFLRISCFGKLIVTKFRGSGGPPMLGGGMGGSGIVDRSCNPPRTIQSPSDPCACGAARAAGGSGAGSSHGGPGGVCAPARDPYNTMPCEDPDDPCYCTGQKQDPKQQMACRNTQQYCLHVPKGAPPGTLLRRHSSKARNLKLELPAWPEQLDLVNEYIFARHLCQNPKTFVIKSPHHNSWSSTSRTSSITVCPSTSVCTIRSKRNSVCFANSVNYIWRKYDRRNYYIKNISDAISRPKYGSRQTAVYMTLYDQFCRHRTSGTQATASINKSFQVSTERAGIQYPSSSPDSLSMSYSPYSISNFPYRNTHNNEHLRRIDYSEMYFFSRKQKKQSSDEEEGRGLYRSSKSVQAQSTKHSTSAQTNKKQPGSSSGTTTTVLKAVSIKEPDKRKCCVPDAANNDSGLSATISHIRIAPRQSCPIHGTSPCQGPNCVAMGLGVCPDPCANYVTLNSDSREQKVPIKVSTTNNPRRGVFEIVVRRLDGGSLAKNELFLEWSPPPGRSPSCCAPYPLICSLPGPCRPSKCKIPVCRPSKPICCKKPLRCKFPCGPKTSRCGPCGLCGRVSCPGCPAKPCCRPCRPKSCRPKPCRPKPCRRRKPCPPCKPCRPCYPPFPFKPSCTSCTVCCSSIAPCPKPCSSCRPCKPCKRCRPPSCKPCKPCFPYRPCVPDLACPASKTSIVFASTKSKCKPCSPCDPCTNPCSPFPSCFSCYPCVTFKPSFSPASSTCTLFCPPSKSCVPCVTSNTCTVPCNPCVPCDTGYNPYKIRKLCRLYRKAYRPSRLSQRCKPSRPCSPSPCRSTTSNIPRSNTCIASCTGAFPLKPYKTCRRLCRGKCCRPCKSCGPGKSCVPRKPCNSCQPHGCCEEPQCPPVCALSASP